MRLRGHLFLSRIERRKLYVGIVGCKTRWKGPGIQARNWKESQNANYESVHELECNSPDRHNKLSRKTSHTAANTVWSKVSRDSAVLIDAGQDAGEAPVWH